MTSSAHTDFLASLRAFAAQDLEQAHHHITLAYQSNPDSLVYHYAERYLTQILTTSKTQVYTVGEGFAAFIRGGSNLALYEKTCEMLRTIYQSYPSYTLFDIGVGDGMALLPALTSSVIRLDILEPSASMLQKTTQALTQRQLSFRAWNISLQDFLTQESGGSWDIIQATFSLQSIPSEQRIAIFPWLAQHTERLLLVEFDVPVFSDPLSPDRMVYVLERYERGLAEYHDTRDLVALGFLMPVMFGYFDPTQDRTNDEQPISSWISQLQHAGFSQIRSTLVYPYWWASAYLIDATPTASP